MREKKEEKKSKEKWIKVMSLQKIGKKERRNKVNNGLKRVKIELFFPHLSKISAWM